MLNDKLKELKDAKGLTVQAISDKSGVPASTVSRILSGQTESPYFANITDMVVAMGGSLDDLVGIKADGFTEKAEAWSLYERIVSGQRILIRWLLVFSCSMAIFLAMLVVFD